MYYDRTISDSFSSLLENNGPLRWLFDFVKMHNDLDFLIGRNNSKEWISIYRGLTRILSISPSGASSIWLDANKKYKNILPSLYGEKCINYSFQNDINNLIAQIEKNPGFDRYYKNKKEGYYQNELSRKYGICGRANDDFVIIDKEAVIGYSNQNEKDIILGEIQRKYKQLQKNISAFNSEKYGRNLEKKAIGNELDFLALDKEGNILLIEYKHSTNTSGIYLSPLQIGMYYDIFTKFPEDGFKNAIVKMMTQKIKLGLINSGWNQVASNCLNKIIPVLIISEYNYKSLAKDKFNEILQFVRAQNGAEFLSNLKTYNFTMENGLSKW